MRLDAHEVAATRHPVLNQRGLRLLPAHVGVHLITSSGRIYKIEAMVRTASMPGTACHGILHGTSTSKYFKDKGNWACSNVMRPGVNYCGAPVQR